MDLSAFGFRKTPFTRELSAKERWSLPHQDEVAEALQDAASSDESAPEVPIQRACASPGILPAA